MRWTEFAAEFCKLTARPSADVANRCERLRRAGLIPTGARGSNAPHIAPVHAARIIVACISSDLALDSPRATREHGGLRLNRKPDHGISRLIARPDVVEITGGDEGSAGSRIVSNPFADMGETLEDVLTAIFTDPEGAAIRNAFPDSLQIWRRGPYRGAFLSLRSVDEAGVEYLIPFDAPQANLNVGMGPDAPVEPQYIEERTTLNGVVIFELARKMKSERSALAPPSGAGREASGNADPEAETPARGANPEPAFPGSSVAQDGANRLNAAPNKPHHTGFGGFFSTPTGSRTEGPSSASATSRPKEGGPATQRGPSWPTSRSRTSPTASPPSTALP